MRSITVPVLVLLFLSTPVVSVETQASNRKLDFVFLLHANQALVPYGDVANDLNYRRVLEVFNNHPNFNLTLHVSGTLISTLKFLSRDTIDYISSGVKSGQYELVGSTYMQNVPYSNYPVGSGDTSGGDFDNQVGMEIHRKILNETFGVSPTVFWNPERVWDPDIMPPLIKSGGYNITFVEDHIIAKETGTDEHLVRSTGDPNDPLYILSDDRDLIMNDTSGEPGLVDIIQEGPKNEDPTAFMDRTLNDLVNYLKDVYDSDTGDEKAVVYAQDMEAWGLWQEERNTDTLDNVAQRLDELLSRLEEESSWLQISHPSDIVKNLKKRNYSFEHLNIPFGEAMWMKQLAVQNGYSSWKEWQDTASFLKEFRTDFGKARSWMFEARDTVGQNLLASRIYEVMKYVYSANQFEFGCWGCNFWWWSRTKEVGIGLEGIKWAVNQPSEVSIYSVDLDGDTFSEVVLSTPTDFYVFSPSGGRLIAWFNRDLQQVLLYNEAPASYVESRHSNFLQYPGEISGFWGRSTKDFFIRQGSFVDFPRYNFTTNFAKSSYSKSMGSSLTFSYSSTDASVRKTFSVSGGRLVVDYEVTNTRGDSMPFYSTFSFNDGSEYLKGQTGFVSKRESNLLEFTLSGAKVGVINARGNKDAYIVGNDLFAVAGQIYLGDVSESEKFQLVLDAVAPEEEVPVDLDPPELTVNVPSGVVSGVIEIEANATDNVGLLKIQLVLNSTVVFERSNSGKLSYYDPEMLTGMYTFTIVATDVYGNQISVTVDISYKGKDVTVNEPSSTTSTTVFPSIGLVGVLILVKRGHKD